MRKILAVRLAAGRMDILVITDSLGGGGAVRSAHSHASRSGGVIGGSRGLWGRGDQERLDEFAGVRGAVFGNVAVSRGGGIDESRCLRVPGGGGGCGAPKVPGGGVVGGVVGIVGMWVGEWIRDVGG